MDLQKRVSWIPALGSRGWPAPERLFNIGSILDGRYEVTRPIGRGGMGWVVEIRRLADGQRLALKYCDGDVLRRKRLIREAKILGGLRHPHLLPVLDSRLDDDPPYFVMPLAAGTLEDEVRGRRPAGLVGLWRCSGRSAWVFRPFTGRA